MNYANGRRRTEISVVEGALSLKSIRLNASNKAQSQVIYNNQALAHESAAENGSAVLRLESEVVIPSGGKLDIFG